MERERQLESQTPEPRTILRPSLGLWLMETFLNRVYKGNPRGTVMVLLGRKHRRVDSREISQDRESLKDLKFCHG